MVRPCPPGYPAGHMPPKRGLKPFQRLLVAPRFPYLILAFVAVLGVLDMVEMIRAAYQTPFAAIGRPSSIAVRLVCVGVFLELRAAFLRHLFSPEDIAARGPQDAHLSEVCEVYGGFLTAAGLFIELVEDTRDHVHELTYANPIATFFTLGLLIFSMRMIVDVVREVIRGPHHG